MAKALAHPVRVRILGALAERTASPSELAQELDVSLGVVSYHVRTLARMGFLKLVRTEPRRGATEHYYRADDRPVITSKAWAQMPDIVKHAMVGATLGQLGQQVGAAALSGGFDRSDAHLTRSPLVLDERGWHELAGKLDQLLSDLEKIGRAAEKRLAQRDHEGEIRATAVMMLFEAATAAESTPTRRRATANAGEGQPRQRSVPR